jgi:hypothetical protein
MRQCPNGHEINGVADVAARPVPEGWPSPDEFEVVCRRCRTPFGPIGTIADELRALAEDVARRLPYVETPIGKWGRWRVFGAAPDGPVSGGSDPRLSLECGLMGHKGGLEFAWIDPWEYLDAINVGALLVVDGQDDALALLARSKMRKAIARLQDQLDSERVQLLDDEEADSDLVTY